MEEIIRDVKSKKFAPVYFLHGEEPYFIDTVADAIETFALPESERSFNQTIVYGKDVDHLTLLDYLRRYPMMSERQVVILREAQEMKSLGELSAYIEQPMETTVFVICHKHKKYDMRTKLGKTLGQSKTTIVAESKKLYDNQIPDWVKNYGKSQHLTIDAPGAAMIAENLGTDLAKIANEIQKLAINLPKGATVTAHHIQEYIGISKDYNVFELQKAFATRDIEKVNRIALYFSANIRKNPLIVTISSLYNYFAKVYLLHALKGQSESDILKAMDLRSDWFLKEYRIAANNYSYTQVIQIIGLLKTYDLRSKGVNNENTSTGEEALMQELFWKILH